MSWKDIGFVSIVLAAALSGLFLAGEARPSDQGDILPYIPGEVLVKFKDSADPASRALLRKSSRARLKRMFSRNSIELLKLEGEHDTETTVKALQASPLVQYAEPNWRVVPLGRVVPGDEYFPRQWPLDAAIASTVFLYDQLVPSGPGFVLERVVITVGDSVIIGTQAYDVDVDIDAPEAWAVLDSAYSGTLGGTVGVIDSGLSETGTFDSTSGYTPDHEDFPSSLFVNTAESSGLAGIDDDLNGYIDDVNGWDWYTSDDASLPGSEPDDDIPGEDPVPADSFTSSAQTNPDPTDYSHGTLVSGIFSAGWDNGAGVASVGQNRLGVLPLRTYLGSDSGIGDIILSLIHI